MKIKFRGQVYPRNITVSVSRDNMEIGFPGTEGRAIVNFRVVGTEVCAEAIFDTEIMNGQFSDIDTLGGMVSSAMQLELDILNIVHGTRAEVDIDQYYVSDKWVKINNYIAIIYEREDTNGREQKYQKILRLLHRGPIVQAYFNPILSDLKRSMQYPLDTGFFCYRAVEIMANYFCGSMKASVKPRHVTAMLKETGASRTDYEFLKYYADPARHGKVLPVPSAVRGSLFTCAWDIFDRFIEFADNDFLGIKSSYEKDLEAMDFQTTESSES